MFEVGAQVVDKLFYEHGHAAVGIVKRVGKNASMVEWPDGQQELCDHDELINNPEA
ncbi:hypothetical protein SEA_CHARM_73 [Mycobacterium phage Charm]|nr:hypothetical protein SEA_CHARM_73 [Mycobacterium phage Charm]QGJ88350.1 hypothetical protein SEA_DREAMTEAM1_73 [Mycobacterium phage DreamTeam1]